MPQPLIRFEYVIQNVMHIHLSDLKIHGELTFIKALEIGNQLLPFILQLFISRTNILPVLFFEDYMCLDGILIKCHMKCQLFGLLIQFNRCKCHGS